MSSLFDTHCHLDFAVFDRDRNAILGHCKRQGVLDILVPSVSQALWHNTIKVCRPQEEAASDAEQTVSLHCALGLHPIFISQHQPQHLSELSQLVEQHQPVAIGEIGLDFYLKDDAGNPIEKDKQIAFFTKQLIIAKQSGLPAIIHCRKAHDDCVMILQEIEPPGGIIHNFNGSIQHAQKYIEMGFKLGFGGMLTFERSRKLRNLAKQVPLTAIVLETDAPDLTVAAHQGQRNSPEYLPHVLHSLAEIKQRPVDDVARVTTNNAHSVLKLPNPPIH